MRHAPTDSRATTAGKWLLALVIPASALALGSVPTEVLVVMSFAAAAACALLWSDRDVRTSHASRWVLLALGVLLGMTVVQAVPFPTSWARILTPANADIWDRALSPLAEAGPAWHSLSVAPAATRVEVLRGFFYGSVVLAALRVATLEHGERFLIRLVVFSTLGMAFSALAHAAVGAQRVFGIYRPRELYFYVPGHLAPLLNSNHLSAYLNIGAFVALWALLARRAMPRPLAGSAALVLAATSAWQGSRGATGTLLLGVVATIVLTFFARRRFQSTRAEYAILAGCVVAAAATVSIATSDRAGHLLSRNLIKVAIARDSLRLVTASPWFGVGRGAFESVFSSVREGTTYYTFTNPEDIVVQWCVEWGLPASVVGAGLLVWALRPRILLGAVRPAIGVWVAIVATIVHEVVDFHLEVPGVAALVAVCVAIVVSSRATSPERANVKAAPSPGRLAAFGVAVGTVIAMVWVCPDIGHMLAEERRALGAMAVDKSASREEFRSVVRASMLRYPAEPFLPLMGAVRAQVNGEGSVVPWVGRSLERNAHFGRAHLILARSLGARHSAQARLEYRLAYEYDETIRDHVVGESVALVEDVPSALELVPQGPTGMRMLEGLVAGLGDRLPSTARILDGEIESRFPGELAPLRRRVDAAVSDVTSGAPWCAGTARCVLDATRAAAELAKREPDTCRAHLAVARLAVASGDVKGAFDGLEGAIDSVTNRAECEHEVIELALLHGQTQRADRALDLLVRSGCGSASDCSGLYKWAADAEERRGHYLRAVQLYRRLIELEPDSDGVLEHIGALGEKDGLATEAIEAYRTLAARHPSDPRWPARLAELRAGLETRRAVRPAAP